MNDYIEYSVNYESRVIDVGVSKCKCEKSKKTVLIIGGLKKACDVPNIEGLSFVYSEFDPYYDYRVKQIEPRYTKVKVHTAWDWLRSNQRTPLNFQEQRAQRADLSALCRVVMKIKPLQRIN